MRRKSIKTIVTKILEVEPTSRENDQYLIWCFQKYRINKDYDGGMDESITRARRQVQEERPDLRPREGSQRHVRRIGAIRGTGNYIDPAMRRSYLAQRGALLPGE